MRRTMWTILGALSLNLASCDREGSTDPIPGLLVFAASSTTDVLRIAGKRFEEQTGVHVTLSFDSSSSLAKQILAGAPADIFLSADSEWMDELESAGAIRSETRADLLGNSLVLIVPTGRQMDLELTEEFEFTETFKRIRRIAIGDPAHVPAGRYARESLESLGWWVALQPKMVPTQNVRAALRLVEVGEADAGIVYASDARHFAAVTIVARFPVQLHETIHYPVAACTQSPVATQFIDLLFSDAMRVDFENAGFDVHALPAGARP